MAETLRLRPGTPGSVIFHLKRWFYARFYGPVAKVDPATASRNKEAWTRVVNVIREALASTDADTVVRLELTYEVRNNTEFVPVGARITTYRKMAENEVKFV